MEVFLLQQSIEKIKDDILYQINVEMKKAIRLIEEANTRSELQIKTFALDSQKIESIKSQLGSIFGEYQFKVESEHNSESAQQLAAEVIDRITNNPMIVSAQNKSANPAEKSKESKTDEQSKVLQEQSPLLDKRNTIIKEKIDHLKPSFSSLRILKDKETKGNGKDQNSVTMREVVDSPIKETLFESVFKPQPSSKLESSKRLFEFEAELQLPDVTDTNFNEFLENELEKIKRTFLEDKPAQYLLPQSNQTSRKQSERLTEEANTGSFSKRALSIGHKKSGHALTQSPKHKKLSTLSYKEKFEELYFKGKKVPKERAQSKNPHSLIKASSKGFLSPVQDLQDETKPGSKSLSKYSRPHGASLVSFSPLFKAD